MEQQISASMDCITLLNNQEFDITKPLQTLFDECLNFISMEIE